MMADALRRSWVRWIVGGVLIGLVVVTIVLMRSGDPVVVRGDAGSEDGLRFEVGSAACSATSLTVGSRTLRPEQGTFCRVEFRVRNMTEDPRSLDASCQYLVDRSGERHSLREDIALISDISGGVFRPGLRPGAATPDYAALYYDVPEGTEMLAVELHSDCGSDGLRFDVRD